MTSGRWRAVVLAAVVALGIGAGVAWVVAPAPMPSWSQEPETGTADVAVTPRLYAGASAAPATAKLAAERELALPSGGVLRESECRLGRTIASGTTPFLLDDRRMLVLHTSTPLWRDLGTGSRGDDVLAVQDELTRLGYTVATTGYYGVGTASAVRQMWSDAGVDRMTTLPISRTIWLPKPKPVAAGCPLQVGRAAEPGDVAVVTGGDLRALTLTLEPEQEAQELVAVIGDEQAIVVPDSAKIVDREFLRAYAHARTFVEHQSDPSSPLTVQLRLAEPVDVVAVPPSALYAQDGTTACLLSGGMPEPVTVIASELGQTLVAGDPLPARVRVDPGQDAPPCR